MSEPTPAMLHFIHWERAIDAAEIRGLIFRNILSSPHREESAPVTRVLVDLYMMMLARAGITPRLLDEAEVERAMRLMFMDGYAQVAGVSEAEVESLWIWPASIPRDGAGYPEDLFDEIAWHWGADAGSAALHPAAGLN